MATESSTTTMISTGSLSSWVGLASMLRVSFLVFAPRSSWVVTLLAMSSTEVSSMVAFTTWESSEAAKAV